MIDSKVNGVVPGVDLELLAREREVYTSRRRLAPESHGLLLTIFTDIFTKSLKSHTRIEDVRRLGTTIVGRNNFSREIIVEGPPTSEIAAEVPTANHDIPARLGGLSLFGVGNLKIGFTLLDPYGYLYEEHGEFARAWARRGYQLVYPFGCFTAHMSFGKTLPESPFRSPPNYGRQLLVRMNTAMSRRFRGKALDISLEPYKRSTQTV